MKTLKELKKGSSKRNKVNVILFFLIVLITLFFSVGYSLLNKKLKISGEVKYRVIADMRITSLEFETSALSSESWHEYGKNNVKMEIELSDALSYITYSVKILNMGENVTMLVSSIEDNIQDYYPYIKYEISGFTPGTEDSIRASGESEIQFTITFSYIDEIRNGTQSLPENHIFIPNIIFNFEEVYSINYDLDGETLSNSNPTWYSSSTPSFTLNNPTKKGYTFLGWTGTNLDNITQTVTVPTGESGARNYIANWKANIYTFTINANGGSYSGDLTQQIIYNNQITINNPTKTGYIFNGWTLSNNESSMSGTTFTMGAADTTLTANWTAITYTINYNCNGLYGSTTSSAHTYDVSKNLTSNGCTMSNSEKAYAGSFIGWSTSSSATAATYTNSQSVKNLTMLNNDTITLYAVWNITSVTYSKQKINSNASLKNTYKTHSSGTTYFFTTNTLYTKNNTSYGDYFAIAASYQNTYGEFQITLDENLTNYKTLSFTINKCTDYIGTLKATYNFGVGTSKNYSLEETYSALNLVADKVTVGSNTRYCSGESTLSFDISNLSSTGNNLYIKVTHGSNPEAHTVWLYIKGLKLSK